MIESSQKWAGSAAEKPGSEQWLPTMVTEPMHDGSRELWIKRSIVRLRWHT
jgi:hypothetical protein